MRRFVIFLFLLFILFRTIYCEQFPIVSTPIEIKNYVNFYDENDFAIYKIYILNPTNFQYFYRIYTISIDWLILYGKNNLDQTGIILANQTKEIIIYLRPLRRTNQVPTFLISFLFEETKHSVNVLLNPFIVYRSPEEIIPPRIQKLEIIPEKLKRGDTFMILLEIYNPNNFEINVPIMINTSYGYKKEILAILIPGNNIIKLDTVIPTSLNLENFTIEILIGKELIKRTINLLVEKIFPNIEFKKNYIIITNPSNDTYLYYEFEMPYSRKDFLIYRLYPKPYEYVIRDGNIYAKWKIILLPGESYIIKKSLDYYFILVILVILSLFIAFIILILRPNVEIKKEITRFSPEEKIMRVVIYIKNKGLLSINNVIIRDKIPETFKINKYDIVEPVGLYKEGKETILEWSYDKIKPKEEIIISYTLTIPESVPKMISIPSASIYYNYMFKERFEISNKITINLIK